MPLDLKTLNELLEQYSWRACVRKILKSYVAAVVAGIIAAAFVVWFLMV